jgi:hypothetical protein
LYHLKDVEYVQILVFFPPEYFVLVCGVEAIQDDILKIGLVPCGFGDRIWTVAEKSRIILSKLEPFLC